jgi:hypothetical protein
MSFHFNVDAVLSPLVAPRVKLPISVWRRRVPARGAIARGGLLTFAAPAWATPITFTYSGESTDCTVPVSGKYTLVARAPPSNSGLLRCGGHRRWRRC